MDFMRGTVRVINQLETNSRFNGKRGDDQRYKNCPKYKWKKVKNHSLFKSCCACFIVNQILQAMLVHHPRSSGIVSPIFPVALGV